jgi:hypothetical protein
VRDYEILAAGFANDPRIRLVARHAGANRLPHVVEDGGASCEVHAGEITM